MKKYILLYSHSGSYNHGCEALARSIIENNKNENFLIQTTTIDGDRKFGLDKIATLVPLGSRLYNESKFVRLLAKFFKIFKITNLYWHGINKPLYKYIKQIKLAVSIGGDTYCYSANDMLEYQNHFFNKRKIPTILYGASINENVLNKRTLKDLKRYKIITCRECETFNFLSKKGLGNIIKTIDSAFFLKPLETYFPHKKCIGINLSPLLANYGEKDLIFNNYVTLCKWILNETDYNICLIPHVNISNNSDYCILEKLSNALGRNKKIILLSKELNCQEIKYVISKMDIVVAARTHVSIASYSSFVPCFVVGYSVKSIGIAKDIFSNDYSKYVVSTKDLQKADVLLNHFLAIYSNLTNERIKLENKIGPYLKTFFEPIS